MRKALPIVLLTLVLTGTLHGQWLEQGIAPGESVWASSSLTETIGGRPYHYSPEALFDSDPSTPWVEGSEGSGVGESVTVLSNRPIRDLALVNGFAASSNLFEQNGRIRDLKMTLMIGFTAPGLVSETDYTLYFLQEFDAGIHTLKDDFDWQSIDFPLETEEQSELCRKVLEDFAGENPPLYRMMLEELGINGIEVLRDEDFMLMMEIYGFTAVRLEIASVYPGSRYQDCCLSELRFNLGEF